MKILSLPFGTQAQIIAAIKTSKGFAGFELRSDFFTEKLSFRQIRKACAKKLILALRPSESNATTVDINNLQAEKKLCQDALKAGFDFIDIDCLHTVHLANIIEENPKRFIISIHTDADKLVTDSLESLQKATGQLKKIALANCSCAASFLFIARCRKLFPRYIFTVMGESGEWTRSSYGSFNGEWGYFCLEQRPTADGQLSLSKWEFDYGHHTNKSTLLFGLIGTNLTNSLSPALHNYAFRHFGINAIYNRFPITDVAEFLQHCPPQLVGLSVTAPLKEKVVCLLSDTIGIASIAGAVNTLKRDEYGRWLGFNTDGSAIRQLLDRRQPNWTQAKQIIIIGTGGVARACLACFGDLKDKIILSGRNPDKTRLLARHFQCDWRKINQLPNLEHSVLLQCSSGELDLPVEATTLVVELIYQTKTPLLQKAQNMNCCLISGHEIFLAQALMQQEIWFGQSIDEQLARQKLWPIKNG